MSPVTGYSAGIVTNDVILSYAPEVTWGVKPAVAFNQIRITGEDLAKSKSRARPNEMSGSGQVAAAVTTKNETKGNIKMGLSTATPHDLLAASILAAPDTALNFANKATVASTASGFTDSGNGFIAAGLAVGEWLRVSGFTGGSAAQINGYYQVLTIAAGVVTTLPAPGAVKAAGDSVTFTGSCARNGTNIQSFYFQKQLASDKFLQYPAFNPIGGSLSIATGGFFEVSIDALIADQVKATVDGSTGAQVAPGTGAVFDGVTGLKTVYRGAAAFAATLNKLELKWQMQGARSQYGLGSAAAQGFGKGDLEVSGSVEMYFKDFTYYDEFINETGSMIAFPVVDSTGAGYIFTVTNGTLMNPKIVSGGPGQDVMATFEIEGNPSSASGIFAGRTFQIDKVT